MDQNNPARYLDTAYNALKSNPSATNQVLQAAAQGAPVGLKGLAAAAAQQSQQQAQQAMAALQQQGPQPNIVQKLATQGIMSQMDTGLPMAPQMGSPEEMPPQMMAAGGLVSFAEGGGVLPPDVIDAIQSHFASGGDVRGFAGGEDIDLSEALRRSFGFGPKAGATAEEIARLENIIAGQRIPMGMEESLRVPFQGQSELSVADEMEALRNKIAGQRITQGMSEAVAPKPFGLQGPHPSAIQDEMSRLDEILRKRRASERMLEGMSKSAQYNPEASVATETAPSSMTAKMTEAAKPKLRGMTAADAAAEYERLTPAGAKWAAPASEGAMDFSKLKELAGRAKGLGSMAMDIPMLDFWLKAGGTAADLNTAMAKKVSGLDTSKLPAWLGGAETPTPYTERSVPELGTVQYPYEEEESEEQVGEPILRDPSRKKAPATKTWQQNPDPHTGTQATPKQIVHEEGQKVDKAFEQAKVDTGTKTTDQQVEAAKGLDMLGGGGLEHMRDLIAELRGHKEMAPEMSQRLADIEDKARTSTIIQSVLGGFAGGLSNPYGGRFALGSSAAGALGGYQKGIASEEEIGRKAFDVLRGYADAPAEEQAKAVDLLFGQMGETAKLQSAERIAAARGNTLEEKLAYLRQQELYRMAHPELHGGALGLRGSLTQGDILQAELKATQATEEWAKTKESTPPFKAPTEKEKQDYKRNLLNSAMASATGQSTGLGGNINTAQSGGLGGGSPLIITRQ